MPGVFLLTYHTGCFMKKYLLYFILNLLLLMPLKSQSIKTDVISSWAKYSNASNSLYYYMSGQAYMLLDKRQNEVMRIHSREEWQKRQETVKKTLLKIIGPFPQKTPLNVKITGRLQRDNYHVEKLIYESQPGFYVSAALFIPNGLKNRAPAVIYCSGHTKEGFRNPVYQRAIINLVKKGFIVLAYDPIGQGERMEYFNPQTGKSEVGGPTLEHSYAGAQCFLIGSNEARYMIWDGIRAVDYLLSRKEVDGGRIGITGRSGGGTQSSYIAAIDERIKAAAPECYITSLKRLVESRSLQDAEQNFYHGMLAGIDHADLIEARAPKPTLLIGTTRDFFSIQGLYETFAEAKKAFEAYGKSENLSLAIDDAEHKSTCKNREAMYRFFQKYLQNPGSAVDEDVQVFTESELYATKSGQISVDLKGESIYSLNKKEYLEKFAGKKADDALAAAKKLSGYQRNGKAPKAVFCGSYNDSGLIIQKYYFEMDGGYALPFILLRPQDSGKHPAVIYLNPQGKKIYEKDNAFILKMVKDGHVVLLPDLLGYGEIGGSKFHGDAYGFKLGKANYNLWFYEIQTRRSLCAVHAADISSLIDFLENKKFVESGGVSAIAEGVLCPSLTYAAAFDTRIDKTALISPFVSYKSLLLNRFYKPQFMRTAVGGMLQLYDLENLYAVLNPRKLLLLNVTDQLGNVMGLQDARKALETVKSAYDEKREDKFIIKQNKSDEEIKQYLIDWIK